MVSIAAIAARVRPSLAGAGMLAMIAVVPWAEHRRHERPPIAASSGELAGSEIVLTPWDRVQLTPQHFEILVPPTHPDAQDWPRGMVIGRNAPSVDPGILQWFGSPLANVMSVFLAPWAALANQLDS